MVGRLPLVVFDDLERLADENPETFIELELTDVTLPLAKPTLPNPPGRCRPEPLPPLGGPPDPPPGKLPPLGGPPDPPPENPPNPPEHLPEVGWLMVTVLAVTTLVFEVDPDTVTQSPTATEEAGTVAIWLKVVEVVQLTVT